MIKVLQTVNKNLMKRILKISGIAFLVMLFCSTRTPASAQEPMPSVTYQTFYDDLSPYGDWVDYPEYGYVWHPRVADFRPYSTAGHWVWTDEYQSMWVSDYNWGWAPFHYGRWLYDDFYGWVWVPGYEWSPAWVEWRTGGDYYGWAPLGPGVNIGLNFSFGRYSPPYDYWSFVPRNYILSPRVYDYCVPRGRNTVIINNTTIINNYRRTNNVFVTGPERNEVERYTGRVNAFVLRDSRNPGPTEVSRNTVNVFRPRVQQDNNERRFAPRNFERYDRQNGNVFQRRNQDVVNNEQSRNDLERKAVDQNNGRLEQRNNDNTDLIRRQSEMKRLQDIREQQQQKNTERQNQFERNQQMNQNEIRRQQEQRNIDQQQQQNRNEFQRRQNEMRQQQEMQRQQQDQRNFDQKQNEMRQNQNQRMQQMKQQQQQQQQEQKRQWDAQRQNNGSEKRQQSNQSNQQQRENSFQQRGSQNNGQGNGNGRGRGRHD
jgi:hypothetical protein